MCRCKLCYMEAVDKHFDSRDIPDEVGRRPDIQMFKEKGVWFCGRHLRGVYTPRYYL